MDILSDICFRNTVVGRSFSTFALPKCAQRLNRQNTGTMVNRDFGNSAALRFAIFSIDKLINLRSYYKITGKHPGYRKFERREKGEPTDK